MAYTNEFQKYYDHIITGGRSSKPRKLATKALYNASFEYLPGILYSRPKCNLAIGFVELLQFIAGIFDPKTIAAVAPKAQLDLFTSQSAYGPRVGEQLANVIDELNSDPDSRRAVIMIAHHTDNLANRPCTLSMQFQLRPSRTRIPRELITTIIMRSSDAVWGLPYDIIQFAGISMVVARCVNAFASYSRILIGNAHIYDTTKLSRGTRYFRYGRFELGLVGHTLETWKNWAYSWIAYINRDPSVVYKPFHIRKFDNDNQY